jgi:hypothetical protein
MSFLKSYFAGAGNKVAQKDIRTDNEDFLEEALFTINRSSTGSSFRKSRPCSSGFDSLIDCHETLKK